MNITPIKTHRDYRRILKEIEGLMNAKRNTPEGDRLDVLATLVEAWEAKHYPLDLPDAVQAIKHHMDQQGLSPPISFRISAAATACRRYFHASAR
jgi:HTH-type transcriptional regulator/antitoxin HigA